MKLELKHLAGYLPYGLKTLTGWNNVEEIIGFKDETYFIKGGNVYAYGDIQDCRPILRPLSDLTKEIKVNGEKFVPIDRMELYGYYDKSCLNPNNVKSISYNMIQFLFEWHFDIYGLIEKGLAIDINTINK